MSLLQELILVDCENSVYELSLARFFIGLKELRELKVFVLNVNPNGIDREGVEHLMKSLSGLERLR